jgi:hypothetical protein
MQSHPGQLVAASRTTFVQGLVLVPNYRHVQWMRHNILLKKQPKKIGRGTPRTPAFHFINGLRVSIVIRDANPQN